MSQQAKKEDQQVWLLTASFLAMDRAFILVID
jgi:hypothetical protein